MVVTLLIVLIMWYFAPPDALRVHEDGRGRAEEADATTVSITVGSDESSDMVEAYASLDQEEDEEPS